MAMAGEELYSVVFHGCGSQAKREPQLARPRVFDGPSVGQQQVLVWVEHHPLSAEQGVVEAASLGPVEC
jgi:hypothetical protein